MRTRSETVHTSTSRSLQSGSWPYYRKVWTNKMDLRHKEIDRHTVPRKDSSDSLSILWFTTYPLAQTSGEFDQGKYRFCIMWMAFLRISYKVFDFKLYVFISLEWCCAHWMEEKDYGEDPKRNNIDSFNGFWLDVKKVKKKVDKRKKTLYNSQVLTGCGTAW